VVTGGRGPAVFVSSLESQVQSRKNLVSYNIVNSKLDDGIRLGMTATRTLVLGNTLKRSGVDGIVVEEGVEATRVIHNSSKRNGDDGIEVEAAGTLVARNTTNFNNDFGIDAVRGVIDGGRNRAKGNGNPLQCRNVSCL